MTKERSMKKAPLTTVLAALLVLGASWAYVSTAAGQTVSLTGKIAYNCGGNICVLDLSTGISKQLTSNRASEFNPKLSLDGSKIVFQSGGAVPPVGIYTMSASGGTATRISDAGALPYWSPDGTQIASCIQSSGPDAGIWVMNANGSGKTHLTSYGLWPTWSPDGSQIAFQVSANGDTDIWVMDAANPAGAHPYCSRPGSDLDIVWSPGPGILFAGLTDNTNKYEIYSCNTTSGITRLTTSVGEDYEPTWSPDGSMVAFYSQRKKPGGGKGGGIWVMNADGSAPQFLISGGRQPSWGP